MPRTTNGGTISSRWTTCIYKRMPIQKEIAEGDSERARQTWIITIIKVVDTAHKKKKKKKENKVKEVTGT